MGADPKPDEFFTLLDGETSVGETNSYRPKASGLFEVQGRIGRVTFEGLVCRIRLPSYLIRQTLVGCPKAWCRAVPHKSRVRPL